VRFPFGGVSNAPLPPLLRTGAELLVRGERYVWRVIHCPQRSGHHEHDGGVVGRDNPRAKLAYLQLMPCGTRGSRWGYYYLVEVA
jgi:hypothetical protein